MGAITGRGLLPETDKLTPATGELDDRAGELIGTARRYDRSRAGQRDEFRQRADIGDDCRQAGSHRFEQGDRQAFADRREHEYIGGSEPVADVALFTTESDNGREIQLSALPG